MQALEDDEDPLEIFGLHADTVVPDREGHSIALACGVDIDAGNLPFLAVFQGVADEILEDQGDIDLIIILRLIADSDDYSGLVPIERRCAHGVKEGEIPSLWAFRIGSLGA